MNENSFPIKYAIMPVTNFAIDDMLVLGYVVTKVYVIMEQYRYLPNGTKSAYNIVYPVKGLKSSQVMADIRKPEFDADGRCINSDVSYELFDTFEEAKKVCTERNNNLFRADVANYSVRTEQMQNFELQILKKTVNLPNPEDIKNNIR